MKQDGNKVWNFVRTVLINAVSKAKRQRILLSIVVISSYTRLVDP